VKATFQDAWVEIGNRAKGGKGEVGEAFKKGQAYEGGSQPLFYR